MDESLETVYRRVRCSKRLRPTKAGNEDAGLATAGRVIPLAGGIAFGLVWGWLLAQRFAIPAAGLAAAGAAALAAAALAGEAALLAGRDAALGTALGCGAGALLRIAFSRTFAHRQATP